MMSLRNARFELQAPLPMRDGVVPSRVYLPQGPWATILDFLVERFRFLSEETLRSRLENGHIVDQEGVPQRPGTPYKALRWLWYYREAPHEQPVPFRLPVLHHDARLVVVDKPHFLASIPGGRHVRETALSRLRHALDLPLLTPVHRLDRETAGVMLFCADPASRGAYQRLFQTRMVRKEYEAIALWRNDLVLPVRYRSRLGAGVPHFLMCEEDGEPNSETYIELLARYGQWAHYLLRPLTGRKHQLRVHLSALQIPICNDDYYPRLLSFSQTDDDYSRPLQLLSRAVEFTDPFSGTLRRFESRRTLKCIGKP